MNFRIGPLLLALVASGCAEKSSPPAPPAPVVRLHADMLVLREEARLLGLDSASLRRRSDSLFLLHGSTPASYEEALRTLRADLTAWKLFNERVAQRLDTLRRQSEPASGTPPASPGPK